MTRTGSSGRVGEDWREFFGERPRRAAGMEASDRKQEAMLNTAARPITLQEYLLAQFRLLETSEPVSAASTDIVYNLDAAGYLQYPLEDMAAAANGRYTLADAETALRLVQGLDPTGVGARNLKECLLLQAGENASALVRDHYRGASGRRRAEPPAAGGPEDRTAARRGQDGGRVHIGAQPPTGRELRRRDGAPHSPGHNRRVHGQGLRGAPRGRPRPEPLHIQPVREIGGLGRGERGDEEDSCGTRSARRGGLSTPSSSAGRRCSGYRAQSWTSRRSFSTSACRT